MHDMYLMVTVRPNAGKNMLIGTGPGRLEAWIKAKPMEGRANEAVVTLLARGLRRPASAIRLIKGAHKRHKVFRVMA